jgi:hypothetical protein
MKRLMIAILAVLLPLGMAFAAGPYDGTWTGPVNGSGTHCPPGAITMRIADGRITGNIRLSNGTVRLDGTVAADGSATASYNYVSNGTSGTVSGKFSGGQFTGTFDSKYQAANASCSRDVSAKRS